MMVQYHYPERFRQVIQSESGSRAYKSYMAMKISVYQQAMDFTTGQQKEYLKLKKTLEKLQGKADKLLIDREALIELDSNDAKVQKKLDKVESNLDKLSDELVAAQDAERKFVEEFLDKFYDDFYEIAKTHPQGFRPKDFAFVDPFETTLNLIEKAGKHPMFHQDSDRLIGNKDVVQGLYPILEAAKEYQARFLAEFSGVVNIDTDKLKKRSEKKIVATEKLIKVAKEAQKSLAVIEEIVKVRNSPLGNLKDYKDLVKIQRAKLLSAWGSIAQSKYSVFPDMWKDVRNTYQASVDTLDELLRSKNKQDALLQYQDFARRFLPKMIDRAEMFVIALKKRELPKVSPYAVFQYIEGDQGEGGFVKDYTLDVLDPLAKHGREYPELLNEADKAGLDTKFMIRKLPRAELLMKEGSIESKIEKPYKIYLKEMVEYLETIIDFAKLFTGVKSLYPLAMPTKAVVMNDRQGRNGSHIHFIKSMDRLLNEAVGGESMKGLKAQCLTMAYRFYPNNPRVIKAYRTYQKARLEGWY